MASLLHLVGMSFGPADIVRNTHGHVLLAQVTAATRAVSTPRLGSGPVSTRQPWPLGWCAYSLLPHPAAATSFVV